MKAKKSESGAENPEKFTGLKLGRIKKNAGGLPAVISSIRHVVGEAGLSRGWKALKKLNQKDGFIAPVVHGLIRMTTGRVRRIL